mgnify:FL=1
MKIPPFFKRRVSAAARFPAGVIEWTEGGSLIGKFYRSQAGTARLEPRDGSADRLRSGAERL